ncbi:hypothetical protein SCLCIDRAFT_1224958 [Scleroderma citrinum Foug A]|uniref:Uncharacterized protein n=1 Tax=Scleroderma citrinum Foug A TaxID=1036808 RepID=A0A0C3D4D3_9AGAM|nr:hypothetical protein SCLCIDRAFT_1224958 [Scleroderma citrinum Foug A]
MSSSSSLRNFAGGWTKHLEHRQRVRLSPDLTLTVAGAGQPSKSTGRMDGAR